MAEHHCEATVAPVSDLYEKARNLPMGNLHEEFGQTVQIRGNYEKQVKVRGRSRPLTKDTGQQKPTGLQRVFEFWAPGSLVGSV